MTRFQLGKYTIRLDTVDSTNNYASRMTRNKEIREGTVILADRQTSGKGQTDNKWESEPCKNLTFSFVLNPAFLSAEKQFYISMSVANGIIDFLGRYDINARIKWPNDIFVSDSKIAGILIENMILGNCLASSVIGIGMNVNQRIFPEMNNPATSMYILKKCNYELAELYQAILEQINPWIDKLYEQAYGYIKSVYLNNLKNLNQWKGYCDASGSFEGKIVDVAESGSLIVKKRNEALHSYGFKEITYCPAISPDC